MTGADWSRRGLERDIAADCVGPSICGRRPNFETFRLTISLFRRFFACFRFNACSLTDGDQPAEQPGTNEFVMAVEEQNIVDLAGERAHPQRVEREWAA